MHSLGTEVIDVITGAPGKGKQQLATFTIDTEITSRRASKLRQPSENTPSFAS
ncbi:MAG TPA: hypothetical protein VMB85_12540 [Bryobacteraceae bacterium]|nr:hypothetical protein [Bryobacteraceae bacterium]